MHIKKKTYSGNSSPMLIACRPVEKAVEGKKGERGEGKTILSSYESLMEIAT